MIRFLIRLILMFGALVLVLLSWGLVLLMVILFVWWLNNQSQKTTQPSASKPAPIEIPESPASVTQPAQEETAPTGEEGSSADTKVEVVEEAPPTEEPAADVEPEVEAEITPANLKRIEGIGPKTSSVLQEAGVLTFAQLATMDVGDLRQILDDAGIGRIVNPETWPEQAKFASVGDWDGLAVLQDELKGGRRVK